MVNKKREMLENWVYGLFGYEERTFLIIRKLIKDLLDNDFTGFKSEYIDYPDGETYRLDLSIRKIENNEPKKNLDKPITVKIDAEEVLKKIQEEKYSLKLYDKLGRYPCKYMNHVDRRLAFDILEDKAIKLINEDDIVVTGIIENCGDITIHLKRT